MKIQVIQMIHTCMLYSCMYVVCLMLYDACFPELSHVVLLIEDSKLETTVKVEQGKRRS